MEIFSLIQYKLQRISPGPACVEAGQGIHKLHWHIPKESFYICTHIWYIVIPTCQKKTTIMLI